MNICLPVQYFKIYQTQHVRDLMLKCQEPEQVGKEDEVEKDRRTVRG